MNQFLVFDHFFQDNSAIGLNLGMQVKKAALHRFDAK